MRIAMVGLRGLPATYGGIERHVEEIGARLVERGHEVTVFCRSSYTARATTAHRGVRLVRTPTLPARGVEALVHSALGAAATLGRGYDVTHFHALGPGLFTPVPRWLSGSAVVQTIHGLDDQRAKWGGLASRLLRLGGWLSARVPHEVVTVSRSLTEHYRSTHGRHAHYIPNGAPMPRWRPPSLITRELGLRGGDYALFVGRLVPEKDPAGLIRAFAGVPTDKRLVIAGGSSHTDGYVAELRALADRDPRVLLTGYRYDEFLEELLSNAAVFVQPSRLEGLPLTLLEAAAYGRPIIASDIDPHVEIIGTGGPDRQLFRAGDTGTLGALLSGALQGTGEGCTHDGIVASYDWDAVTDALLDVYAAATCRA